LLFSAKQTKQIPQFEEHTSKPANEKQQQNAVTELADNEVDVLRPAFADNLPFDGGLLQRRNRPSASEASPEKRRLVKFNLKIVLKIIFK